MLCVFFEEEHSMNVKFSKMYVEKKIFGKIKY